MSNRRRKYSVYAGLAAIILWGVFFLNERHYTIASVLIAAISCLIFAVSFERKELTSRYTVVIAVMTALSVTGRFLFAPVPAFKPVTAVVILSGIYLSAEGGFLTGAMTALISNMYFGHGAWTPFQMLAWGMIGAGAGLLSKPLKKSRLLLLIYGAISGAVYSLVMDLWTVLWYSGGFSGELYKASVISALYFMIMYAASNVVFLFLIGQSFGRKLNRAVTLIER